MAAISAYHHFYCVLTDLLTLLLCFSSFSISFANIRDMQIKYSNDTIIDIDDFEFAQTGGRLELNVSNIYISILDHSNNLNLSNTGFFISHTQKFSKESLCLVGSSDILKWVYTFDKLGLSGGSINKNHFEVVLSDFFPVDNECYFMFVSCIPGEHAISFYVQYAMYNLLQDGKHRCYLSLSELLELRSLVVLISIYLLLSGLYLIYHVLSYKTMKMIIRIHKFMLVVLLLKVFSLGCKWLDKYYIMTTGCSQCWASTVLIIISDLLSRVPQAVAAILIGSGWSYIKTSLSSKDKMLLTAVININIVAIIVVAVVDHFDPFKYGVRFFYEFTTSFCSFLAVRLAAQAPLKYLRRAGIAEGKAADCLSKIDLLRLFLGFLYTYYALSTTPIMIADLLRIWDRCTNFKVNFVSKESMTLVFYVLIGYMFRPNVLRLKVPVSDDVEKDAAKVHANPPDPFFFDPFGDHV